MFYIIETQTTYDGDGNKKGATIVTVKNTRNEAESEYHRILQYAAISSVPIHGAVILTDECTPLMYKSYVHADEQS